MQTIAHAEDKLLHFFFLAAADFVIGPTADYAVRNVIGIAQANPELAVKVVKTRQMAKMILDNFSRKTIHPVAGVTGGFAKPLLEKSGSTSWPRCGRSSISRCSRSTSPRKISFPSTWRPFRPWG
jgi:coenzyme F420-reducing hydrogenase alpha subunit